MDMKVRNWVAVSTALMMTACGGGGGDAGTLANGTTGTGSAGSNGGTGVMAGSVATRVDSVVAPADGVDVSGTLQLVVNGAGLGNVELLPVNSAQLILGRFSVAPDGNSATLAFDTNQVPNGTLTVRIAAFNAPPGTSGATEVPAMQARTWRFANAPPPTGNDVGRTARCEQMGFAGTAPDPSNPVVCVTYAHTSTPIAQCTSFGTGYGSPEDLLEVLRNGSRVSKLYCQPGANNGVLNPGCFCLS